MMKRLAALLAALCLMFSFASAQEISTAPIASYTLPQGAEALHVMDSLIWEAPEGLDELYAIMRTVTVRGDVYLVRMPHGRAMVSVSCTEPDRPYTAQELLALWPQIAQTIAREGVTVNADEACADVRPMFGFDALHIQTAIGLGEEETGLRLDAQGTAFMRGDELLEVWAVAPVEGSYADEALAAELFSDRAAMAAFMETLSFTDLESMAIEGVPFTDPLGRFAVVLPSGCTIITPSSTEEEISRARDAYLAAHGEGADVFFQEYLKDVKEENVIAAFSPDQQIVAEFFGEQVEDFRDITPEQLAALAQPIQQSLAERFEAALILSASEQATISGSRHAWLGYWLRSGQVNAQLDVMAAVLPDAWLYEVDLFTHGNDQDARSLWFTFITQTLRYTPPGNALD